MKYYNKIEQEKKMSENLEKYISIINSQLDMKKGEENLEELVKLFETDDVIEKLKSQRMDSYLRTDRKRKKDNKQVVKFLLEELGVLLREEESGNENIEFFYFYLKGKRAKRECKNLFFSMMGIVLAIVMIYLGTQWWRVDSLLLYAAPSKDEICKIVEERYDLKVEPNNIQIECRLNDHYKTYRTYPQKVVYTISAIDENREVIFSGRWIPYQELFFDYEMVVINEYLEKHSINVTESEMTNVEYNGQLAVLIEDMESKEVFMKQFEDAFEDIFDNKYLSQRFSFYFFTLILGEGHYEERIHIQIEQENLAEDLNELSDELDTYLGQ